MPRGQTKKNLLDEAARLFAEKGYNVVTVREIGAAVGLNESAIYRNYIGKEDILNEIMSEFSRKLRTYLLTPEKVEPLLETDTPRKLLNRFDSTSKFHESELEFMRQAFRVVFMEQLTNERAKEIIIGQLHKETADSIKYVLDKLIERGSIPEIDTGFLAEMWAHTMFSVSLMWMYHYPDTQKAIEESEKFRITSEKLVNMALSGKAPPKAP